MTVLKVGVLYESPKHFTPQNWGIGNSFPIVMCCAKDGIYGKSLSPPLLPILCEYFLGCPLSISQSIVSEFLSEGIAPHVALYSVHLL